MDAMRLYRSFPLLAAICFLSPARCRAQTRPWAEFGAGAGGGRTACIGPCQIPVLVSLEGAVGVHFTPSIAAALAGSIGSELNIESTTHNYITITGVVELSNDRVPAFRARAGGGWANTRRELLEDGSGLIGRFGAGVELPPRSSISAMLTADYYVAAAGTDRRHATSYAAGSTGPFNLRMLVFGLSVRLGDE